MKQRYDESFLFPQSQVDFNRGAINFPQGQLHGLPGPVEAITQSNYADYLLETVRSGVLQGLILTYSNNLYQKSVSERRSDYLVESRECQEYYNWALSVARSINSGNIDDALNLVRQMISMAVQGSCPNISNIFDQAIQQQADADIAAAPTAAQVAAQQAAAAQAAAQQAAAQQAAAAQAAAQQAAAQQAAAAQAAAQQAAAQQAAAAQTAAAQAAAQTSATATTKTVPQRVIDFDTAIMALKSYGKYIEGMSAQQMTAALNALSDGNATFLVPERTGAAAAASASATTSTTMATNTSTVGYDLAVSLLKAAGKYTAGMTEQQMATALTALEGNPVFVMTPAATATAIAATKTQTTATNTATGTVQTTDKVSGTTSTVNAATGAVTVTTSTGQTASGTGTVAAGGVITTVDPKAGVVTTQNTQTGVVTQTDAATGKTVTATQITGSAGGGGTFMLPDQKTVSTTTAITSTAAPGGLDSGKIALFGLIGLLLLRGAVR